VREQQEAAEQLRARLGRARRDVGPDPRGGAGQLRAVVPALEALQRVGHVQRAGRRHRALRATRGAQRLGSARRRAGRAPQRAGGLRTPPGVRGSARSRPGNRSECVRLERAPRVLAGQHGPAAHRAAGGRVGERLAVQLEGRRQRRVGGRPVEACTVSGTEWLVCRRLE